MNATDNHAPRCLECGKAAPLTRGLCRSHYVQARNAVVAKRWTWERLVEMGRAAEVKERVGF
jgi:hypothetical protein